jgi:hypothetical protein
LAATAFGDAAVTTFFNTQRPLSLHSYLGSLALGFLGLHGFLAATAFGDAAATTFFNTQRPLSLHLYLGSLALGFLGLHGLFIFRLLKCKNIIKKFCYIFFNKCQGVYHLMN